MNETFIPRERDAFGVVVPFDMELDSELWRWIPAGVDMLITRTPYAGETVDVEFIREISGPGTLADSVRTLTAGRVRTAAYACAAGSFIGGADGERRLREAMTGAGARRAITTSGALVDALTHLGMSQVAVATPYVAELSHYLDRFLTEFHIETVNHGALGYDHEIWDIDEAITADLLRRVDHPGAEAILVSCTNLPTYDLIAPLEQELGKPIITANQATIWAALRALGREAIGADQRLIHAPAAIHSPPGAGALEGAEGAITGQAEPSV